MWPWATESIGEEGAELHVREEKGKWESFYRAVLRNMAGKV